MLGVKNTRDTARIGLTLTIMLAGITTIFLTWSARTTATAQLSQVEAEAVSMFDASQRPEGFDTAVLPETPWMSGGPYGASVREVIFSPVYSHDHQIFAGTWGSGIFWMNDNLGVWESRNNGLNTPRIMALEISPSFADDETLFVSLHGGKVYSTTNSGESWVLADTGLPWRSVRALAISPDYSQDGTVYAGINDNGVYRSQDKGQSWQPVNAGLPVTTVVGLEMSPQFSTSGLVYAMTEGNRLYRLDAGMSWTACADLPYCYKVYSMAMTPDGQTLYAGAWDGLLYVSHNQCQSWAPLFDNIPIDTEIAEIVVSPEFQTDQTMWVASTSGGGLYRSTNAGASWAEVSSGMEVPYNPMGLAVSPSYADDQTLFVGNAGGGGGAYRSTNAGDTWIPRSTGMTWNVIELSASPNYQNDHTVFAGLNGGGVFRSQDGGASWTPASVGYMVGADAVAIALSPEYETDGTLFAAGYGTGVCRSDDRGETWQQVGMEDVYAITEIAIAPAGAVADALMLAGTLDRGVYQSTDGGWSWSPLTPGIPISPVNAIAFSHAYAADHTVFVATDGAGLYRSQDAGETWVSVTDGLLNPFLWSLGVSPDFANDGTLLVSQAGGVYRSRDRGDSWQHLEFPDEYDVSEIAFSPHYATDHTIWLATTQWSFDSVGGVFVSQDGGDSWRQYNNGLPQLDHFALTTGVSESGYDVFVGTTLRSVWQQRISPFTHEWAVFVYINTDNDHLDQHAPRLFNRLELAVANNPALIVRVLWDRIGEGNTVLYDVLPDTNQLLPGPYEEGVNKWSLGEWDLGDPLTLWQFIQDARLTYPAQHHLLALVNHGGGWSPELLNPQRSSLRYAFGASGLSWDVTNNYNYLSTQDMGLIFGQETLVSNPIDIVFYDACLMGMVEEAYEIRRGARYLIASENETWSSFPYDSYLAGIETRTASEQAVWMVDRYHESLIGYPRTLSAIDLGRVGRLSTALDGLANALYQAASDRSPLIMSTFLEAQKLDYDANLVISDTEGYVDLGDFATKLTVDFSDTDISQAATAVLGELNDPVAPVVIHERHQGGSTEWPYYTYMDFAGATGLSIYLPLGEPDGDMVFYRHDQLAFAEDTIWDDFIYAFLDYVPGPIDPDYVGGRGGEVTPLNPTQSIYVPFIIKD